MSDTRREFLANCLGGAAAVALTQGLAAQPSAAAEPTAPVTDLEDSRFWLSAHKGLPAGIKSNVHIRTDLNPINTKLTWQGTQGAGYFVQELLLQRLPNSDVHLAGLAIAVNLLHESCDLIGALQLRQRPVQAGQSPLQLVDPAGNPIPALVLACNVELGSLIATAFVLTTASLELTKLNVQFERCNVCGHHEERVTYTAEPGQKWVPMTEHLFKRCPLSGCHSSDRTAYRMTEADIDRVHITTASSHVLFHDPAVAEKVIRPFEIRPNNRGLFLDTKLGMPISQIYPGPDFIRDVFAKSILFRR